MKKVISISLAILLLTSNLSLAIGTHYCGGLSVKTEVMLGHEHLDCGMAGMDESQNDQDDLIRFEKAPCCQNEYTSVEVAHDFKVPSQPSKTLNFEFIAAFATVFLNPLLPAAANCYSFQHYPPPLPDRDIQVLFQTFLI